MNDVLLRLEDVAKELGVQRRTLLRYIQMGQLPVVRLSQRALRVRRSDLDVFVKDRVTEGVT